MRILICAAEAPVEPLNGFGLQLDRLATGLARGHEVTVLALARRGSTTSSGPEELIPVPVGPSGPAAELRPAIAATLGRSPRAATRAMPAMMAAVAELLTRREFDVAQVSGPWLAGLAHTLSPLPSVLSSLDAWHLNLSAEARLAGPAKRLAYRWEQRNIRRFIASEFRRHSHVIVVSDADAAALRQIDSRLRLAVIPNGVDVEMMKPNPAVGREPGLVVFTGAMHYAPNVEAARFLAIEVLPRLRATNPDARLALVGRQPRPEVAELARIENVEVTGEVPDIRPWLWRANAYGCGMVSGTGIKNKLLEALACGTPCVATGLSCQGIAVAPGRDLLVEDSAGGFAKALSLVLGDQKLGDRLGRRGRSAVETSHGWDAVVDAHVRIYERALAERAT